MKSGEVVCKLFGCFKLFFCSKCGWPLESIATVTTGYNLNYNLYISVSTPADISASIFHGCSYAASYIRNVMSTFLILLQPCSNWSMVSPIFRALERPYSEGKGWKIKAKCQAYSRRGADTGIILSGVFLSALHSKIPAANEHKTVSSLQNGTRSERAKSICG